MFRCLFTVLFFPGNTGCCRGRLKGFTVYGLVQGRRELIHTDGRQNWNTISYKTVIVVQVPQRLHAVKFAGISISIPDYYLTLCEVEVLTGMLAIHL